MRLLLGLSVLLVVLSAGFGEPRGQVEVDLALVLAVDVSHSMDEEEQRLQRDGFVEAFRSPLVHEAIRKGAMGRIAVAYVEWSGPTEQMILLPWTIVGSPDEAKAVARRLAKAPIQRKVYTSISGAIDMGVKLLRESGVNPLRRVIDVSGDSPNNEGRPVTVARDEAVSLGVTINGLPLMLKPPTELGDIENLDLYYQDCVIGGTGAFIVPVREARHFSEAIVAKLVKEIAGSPEPRPTLKLAHAERPSCLIGEALRQAY